MKTISLTNNKEYEIEGWVDRIINDLPEDVATWCFSNLIVSSKKQISAKECHSALSKAWEDIPVYMVCSDMSGQSIKKATSEFLIPQSDKYEGHITVSRQQFDGKLLEKMLTNVGCYTDGSLWPNCIEASNNGCRTWLTYNRYSVYVREFPHQKAYDRNGTHPRVFVWADKIKSDYPDDYNFAVALTVLCSKIEAIMDFDMFGNSYKIERSHSLELVMSDYFKLKTNGLAFGWSLYLLSLEFPDIMEKSFCKSLCNCDVFHRLGMAYAYPEAHYLFEATRVWIETKRRLCFGPIYCLTVFDNYKVKGDDVAEVAYHWAHIVGESKGNLEREMKILLEYDYEINSYSEKLRDETNCGFNKLSTITVPTAVVELRAYLFSEAKPMDIYLHSGIRHIDDDAFFSCHALVHKPKK